ncbi:succinylglutamate desuccinylase/aspartoacylase family protein [Conexibacter sp. CPCC 206217]|uniref:succinylglutamate desuccinylase/aspartoacylase family protein n=1 Tax=Conexibacter sp. CPCC 206217 TaxID=3064574 RepID=UPI0027278F8D|nr:M14 family metallopeptidase [Conexibacter sp. CPCC 206217]MDO8210320.1 M14 family metallopeptidase [Conexibacter sp. CPCC 206217]
MSGATTATAVRSTMLGAAGLTAPVELLELTGAPGPATLAVLAGVHGDEPEGVLAVRRLVRRLEQLGLTGGVLAVPVANPTAWAVSSRTSPVDGGNLARCFPGDAGGGESERLARVLTDAVLARATFLVDLHAAGAAYEMPFFAGALASGPQGAESVAAAAAFGAPLVWEHSAIGPGRSISAAAALGIGAIYVEAGGGGNLRGSDLDGYVDGVLRVMARLGMVEAAQAGVEAPLPPALTIRGGDGDIDAGALAPVDGWCVARAAVGQTVAAGDAIAELLEPDGSHRSVIRARRPGTVAMLRHSAAIRAGDLVCVLAPVAS